MVLTKSQEKGWEILNSNENCFLTGHAGSGKTFLLNKWIKENFIRKKISVLASTGMAAVLIGGRTFHSFFGLGLADGKYHEILSKATNNPKVSKKLRNTDVIIIDEISMISGYLMGLAEEICCICRNSTKPWGGIKLIVVGDFGQLPPISPYGNELDWAFNSMVWKNSNFVNIMLREPVRTDNLEFLSVLDEIRNGECSDKVEKFLVSKEITGYESDDFHGTRLYPLVAKAEEYNLNKLKSLESKLIQIPTYYTSKDDRYLNQLKKSIPIPEKLEIKKDALIMIRVNDPLYRWVNGTLAYVVAHEYSKLTLRHIDSGQLFEIGKHTYELNDDNGKLLASATNFPIILAWACTIHKSQGASIDRLLVDMDNLWEYGQAYVALSRTTNPDNLRILNPNIKSIKAHPAVVEFYNSIN